MNKIRKPFWIIKGTNNPESDWGILKVTHYDKGMCYGQYINSSGWLIETPLAGWMYTKLDNYTAKRYTTIEDLLKNNFDFLLNANK